MAQIDQSASPDSVEKKKDNEIDLALGGGRDRQSVFFAAIMFLNKRPQRCLVCYRLAVEYFWEKASY